MRTRYVYFNIGLEGGRGGEQGVTSPFVFTVMLNSFTVRLLSEVVVDGEGGIQLQTCAYRIFQPNVVHHEITEAWNSEGGIAHAASWPVCVTSSK